MESVNNAEEKTAGTTVKPEIEAESGTKAGEPDPKPQKKIGFWKRMGKKKLEWFVFFFGIALAMVILWPFIAVTVEAGHTGVYFNRLLGGTELYTPRKEGLRLKLPWDFIIQYDSRLQSKEYEVVALTRGGLNVTIKMSVLWFVGQEQAPKLHVDTGPDYITRVIDPAVVSTVRSIVGSVEMNQLYDGDPIYMQEQVLSLLRNQLFDKSFTIHSILVREVILPPNMRGAITDKFVAEQNVIEARYNVLEEVERFKQKYVSAEGTRLAQSIVTQGMSEAYLRYLGIQATLELAKSPNAKLVIIGDKDGMPLILNPDSMDVSMTLPTGLTRDEFIPEGTEGTRYEDLMRTFYRLQETLGDIDDILGSVIDQFPEATPDLGDTGLPQDNRVPIRPRTR